MHSYIELEDGTIYHGFSFGYPASVSGEFVFNTGMTGYPETFTDPSYTGQIIVLTYPLIGNYGVPRIEVRDCLASGAESEKAHIEGVVVADYSPEYSHWDAEQSLGDWLKEQKVPGITGIDTRALTKRLRQKGTMLGRIVNDDKLVDFYDPDKENLVAQVSIPEPILYQGGNKKVMLIDCGCKSNIIRSLLDRGVSVLRVPWNYSPSNDKVDGILVSNGPGNPQMYAETIRNLETAMRDGLPIFGICLGHQLLALAAGAETYKLKYGHRSQNQPCVLVGSQRCYITSQNHGYAVDDRTLPADWQHWFFNANDSTNEGVRHRSHPFMGVQFHPEAFPGPNDTAFLFDDFIRQLSS